jgi:SAM-dependent methyltransferase
MREDSSGFEEYFKYLKSISFLGRLYKRVFSSTILFSRARMFGPRILEVGSGIGSGVLGAFPSKVVGVEINPYAVNFSTSMGLHASLIKDDGSFPVADSSFDACILDNVLEHIEDPQLTLNECSRVTAQGGGMIIAVPGVRGYNSDADHKVFYGEDRLKALDDRWGVRGLFSLPFFLRSEALSKSVKQYCLVAVYRKKN